MIDLGDAEDPSLTPEANKLIRSAIRRSFARTEVVRELLNANKRKVPRFKKDGDRHKVDQVQHLCNICKGWKPGKAAVDHIEPVIDTDTGFVDWNTYIGRVFCKRQNLQVVCNDCHQAKTNKEREKRNTIKYNYFLDIIESKVRDMEKDLDIRKVQRPTLPVLKKEVNKYRSKTRPSIIRKRADELKNRVVMLMEVL